MEKNPSYNKRKCFCKTFTYTFFMLYPVIQKLYFVHFWRWSTLGKFKKIQTRHFHLLNEHLLHSVYSEKLCRGNDIPYYTGVQSKRRFYPNLWAHDILSCNLTASEWKLTEALLSHTKREYVHIYATLSTLWPLLCIK